MSPCQTVPNLCPVCSWLSVRRYLHTLACTPGCRATLVLTKPAWPKAKSQFAQTCCSLLACKRVQSHAHLLSVVVTAQSCASTDPQLHLVTYRHPFWFPYLASVCNDSSWILQRQVMMGHEFRRRGKQSLKHTCFVGMTMEFGEIQLQGQHACKGMLA